MSRLATQTPVPPPAPPAPAPATPPSATSSAAKPNAGTQPDPITHRARMKVLEYRGSRYFWADHQDYALRIVAGLLFLGACGFFSLPWSLTNARPLISGITDIVHYIVAWGAVPIFLMALVAIAYARSALAGFAVNTAIARHVERSAAGRLQEIRRDAGMRGTVSRLESDHLPDNPDNPKPASLRLFQRICAEALDRRFESTINLIEPYQRESMEPVLKLEGLQRGALRWGILCHFIGLVLVINAVPAMMRPSVSATHEPPAQAIASAGSPAESAPVGASSDEAIDEILDGLRLAFGASVAGLSVSLFVSMLLSLVRQRQFAYFRKLDEATSTMISLATNSLNNDELLASLQHVSARVQEQTVTVKEGIQTLASAISLQASTLQSGLKSLGEGKVKLDKFLEDLASSQAEFLKRLHTFYDIGTIADVGTKVVKHVESAHQRTVSTMMNEIGSVQKSMTGLEEVTTLHLGDGLFRYVPHALLALAGASALTLLLLLWRML